MRYAIVVAAFLCGLASQAFATCASPLTGNDGAGTVRTFGVTQSAGGDCYGNVALVDGTNAANKVTVTAAGALKVDGSAVTQPVSLTSTTVTGNVTVVQPTGTNLHAVLDATSTTAVTQATSSSLKAQVDPLTVASWGLAASSQNVAAPTNAQLVMGQFTTSPTTLSTTNVSPLQLDSAGNLLVNIKAGAGSGGTALADGATFTEATTNLTPIGGEYVSGGGANCTTTKACALQMTIDRMAYVNLGKYGGGAITSVPTAYGTAPTGNVIGVNANVTNATPGIANNADAIAAVAASSTSPVPVNNYNYGYNGTTWDRVRTVKSGSGMVAVANGGNFYQHVAASQTAAVLQSSAGAAGDYLSHCVIYPVTTAAGSVTVFDNANAAATNVIEFATGTLSNLAPITIPVGAVSAAGAWKVTTGASETVVCYGKFS